MRRGGRELSPPFFWCVPPPLRAPVSRFIVFNEWKQSGHTFLIIIKGK